MSSTGALRRHRLDLLISASPYWHYSKTLARSSYHSDQHPPRYGRLRGGDMTQSQDGAHHQYVLNMFPTLCSSSFRVCVKRLLAAGPSILVVPGHGADTAALTLVRGWLDFSGSNQQASASGQNVYCDDCVYTARAEPISLPSGRLRCLAHAGRRSPSPAPARARDLATTASIRRRSRPAGVAGGAPAAHRCQIARL